MTITQISKDNLIIGIWTVLWTRDPDEAQWVTVGLWYWNAGRTVEMFGTFGQDLSFTYNLIGDVT